MTSLHTRSVIGLAVILNLLMLSPSAWAEEVGKVAALDGSAEVLHGDAAKSAEVGMTVSRGDTLRTGRPGRMKVVFQDDTMLTLADGSEITINDQVFAPQEGVARSILRLAKGKVRAVVSDYYKQTGARYEVRTNTAVAGVRGTEFTVSYDVDTDHTEILGISGVVAVHSLIDPSGPGVLITASETTSIPKGQLPATPHKLDRELFERELRDVELISGDGSTISSSHAVVNGSAVPDPDRADSAKEGDQFGADGPGFGGGRRDVGGLLGQSPAAVRSTGGQLDIDVGQPR